MYSYLSCYSNVGSVTFIIIAYFGSTLANGRIQSFGLWEGSTEELVRIFNVKIRHFLLYIYPNVALYFNNRKYLYKLNMFCSHNLRNNVGRTDKFRPETYWRRPDTYCAIWGSFASLQTVVRTDKKVQLCARCHFQRYLLLLPYF